MCASPSSGMIAARASATGWRSTIRAASSASPCSTSCRRHHVWEQIRAGESGGASLGVPVPALRPKPEGGDRPRSARLFRGLMAKWSKAGDLDAFDPRALPPTGRASTSRPASTPSARITAPARRVDVEQDEADLAPATHDHLPDADRDLERFYLARGRRRPQQPLDGLAAELRARTPRSAGHIPAISSPRRTRRDARGAPGVPAFVTAPRPLPGGQAESAALVEELLQQSTPPRSREGRHRPPARGGRSAGRRSARRCSTAPPFGSAAPK